MPQTAKRARVARTPAKRNTASRQYVQPTQPRQPPAKVRTFTRRTRGADLPALAADPAALAPDLAPDLEPQPLRPLGSAGHGPERCPGCALTPWPECACCGAPTVYALDAGGAESDAGDLEHAHALTLCAACHALLLTARDPRAEPLRYLPLATLQTKRASQRTQGTQRPTQPKRPKRQTQRPIQLPAKQSAQPAQRTPRKRTQRAKSSAKGGAA